ncbi:MAG: 1-deoxy-D-xylulose-5-phosphate synthase [Clostridia bacterium]|nr:1-deoxy-D-xylulose-5-phosphate synthase [Clostridia bacterium]
MLNKIKNPKDLKKIAIEKLPELCTEIRQALLEKVSTNGGHLAPNLGVVELTTAIHYVFNAPVDKIVFDVSHQTYVHKMLTGRAQAFTDLQHYHDVNGFSNPAESPYDLFTLGHTSTALSLACGLAKARDLQKQKHRIVSIIGDGSLSGGQAYEALNCIAEQGGNIIIIVNDNAMSIAENHGGYYRNLENLRATNGESSDNFFRALGLNYIYEPNGNNIDSLIKTLNQVKDCTTPTVVHVHTIKGCGYKPAETNPEIFHYTAPFDLETGKHQPRNNTENYTSITYQYIDEKMKTDKKIVAVTSATPTATGFTSERRTKAKTQYVDVGIAEEHAVAYIAGMAKGGAHPIYGVQGSFLQRSFDQLHQDLALDNNPATLLVFGDHIHGMGGSTHNGFYDIVQLSNIPNLMYLAPISKQQYLQMLDWSIQQTEHSVAIRVPDQVIDDPLKISKKFSTNSRIVNKGKDVAIIAVGSTFPLAQKVVAKLQENHLQPTLIDPVCVSTLDTKLLKQIAKDHNLIITLEEGALNGGFGQKISALYSDSNVKVKNFGFSTGLTQDFEPTKFLKQNGLTVENITKYILG